jgi:hypothetical protein
MPCYGMPTLLALIINLWLGRVPVRLYVRNVQEDLEYIEDAVPVSDWEGVSYINRPFEIRKVEGMWYHRIFMLLYGYYMS